MTMNAETIQEILDEIYLEKVGASGTENDQANALDIILDVLVYKRDQMDELIREVQEEEEELVVSHPEDDEKDPETKFAEDVLEHVVRTFRGTV